MAGTAEHRPAVRRRRFRHDELTACDLLSGFGGLTGGIEQAGFTTIVAANHNEYKVEVHEANFPHVEHWIADLADPESSDYHSVRDLPPADLLAAGITCFAAGTLILARRGLIPIEQVKAGDEVWTHRGRWRAVTRTSVAVRPTVTVNATTAITCTPDHPFWAASAAREYQPRRKYQPLVGARCLECGSPAPQFKTTSVARLFCSRKCRGDNANRRVLAVLGAPGEVRADSLAGMWVGTPVLGYDGATLPDIDGIGPVTPAIAWLLGRWVGDGWVSRRPDRGNVWSRITICASHAESDDFAKQLARLTDLPWNRTRKRTADTFHVTRVGLAAFIVGNFGHGAAAKRIPAWMLFAPEDIRQAFAVGYASADGHVARTGLRLQASTVSKELAVGMRLLLTSLGYYVTVCPVRRASHSVIEGRTVRQRHQWQVSAYKCRERRPKHRDAGGYRWGKAVGTVKPGETVMVYNMTVEEDHTYVADGVIVHNCTNHSQANSAKAYEQGLTLFELEDPDFQARVTRSERDRATANCFPASTVVVARRGMVPIEQLVVGDEVLTHRNRWRRVTATMSRRAPVVTVQGRGHTALQVTANHQFLTRPATLNGRGWRFGADEAWTPAGDLVGHAWQSPAEFPGADLPAAPVGWEYGDHFWRTVGLWLGDGWIRHCSPPGEIVGICCGYAERAELDGRWDARVTEAATAVQYELRGSGALARWLMAHFGERAQGKTIPSWALSMDAEYRKALVEGYMSADGCASFGGRRGSSTTVSRQLAVGMKLLLQTLGYRPTLGYRASQPWRIEGRVGTTRPMWVLQWMAEQRRASTIATIDGRCVGVVRAVNPGCETEVFDIEVEEDHSFVADGLIVHNCALHYAERHRPRLVLLECTTEIQSWGPAIPGRRGVGDGSTYRWWLKQWGVIGYLYKILYLNSMFFGVPQSRDRWFGCLWDRRLPTPDLEHRPPSWCGRCEQVVEAVWTWRTGVPATGSVRYGKQYDYRCPRCRAEVIPPRAPSLNALDLTDLGTRIGDKPIRVFKDGFRGPMAAATMARAERCRQRAPEFPLVLMPAPAAAAEGHPWQQDTPGPRLIASPAMLMGVAGHTYERPGSDCRSRGLDEPLWTQSATNSTGLLTPPIAVAVDNYQGSPRGAHEPLPTQPGSETMGLLTARILPNRTNATSRSLAEPMQTLVGGAGSGGLGLLTAGGTIKNNGPIEEARYRAHPFSDPLGTVVGSAITQGALFAGWFKQNGPTGTETAPHPLSDPFGTLTSRDTTATLIAEWAATLADLPLEDWYYKMLGPHEVGRGCGFDVSFPGYGYEGTFVVWGSARAQVDGFGNAVSPQVGAWIGSRLRAILDTPEGAA